MPVKVLKVVYQLIKERFCACTPACAHRNPAYPPAGTHLPSTAMRVPLLALLFREATSCAFSRSGLPKPAAHPVAASALPFAPGVPYADLHNDSHYPYPGYDMPSNSWLIPRLVANLSAQSNTALCYWSQQVLPSPPTGFDPATGGCTPSPCAWATPPSAADVKELLALGEQASGAMQYMIDVSLRAGGVPSFLGSQCGSGGANVKVLCRAVDPHNPICNATGLQQRSEWAVASNIIALTPETLDAVYCEKRAAPHARRAPQRRAPPPLTPPHIAQPTNADNVTAWRTSPQLHIPAMTSTLVSKGWGAGGAITFKVLPCADIPATLMGHSYGCMETDPATGKLIWDEAFAFWESYKPAGWLREGLRSGLRAPQAP